MVYWITKSEFEELCAAFQGLPTEIRHKVNSVKFRPLSDLAHLGIQPTPPPTIPQPSSESATPLAFSSYKALEDTLLHLRQTLRNSSGSSSLNLHEAKGQLNFSLEGTMPPPETALAKTQAIYEENLRARADR